MFQKIIIKKSLAFFSTFIFIFSFYGCAQEEMGTSFELSGTSIGGGPGLPGSPGGPGGPVTPEDDDSSSSSDDDDIAAAVAACLADAPGNAIELADGSDIIDENGSKSYLTPGLKLVNNIGSLSIYRQDGGSGKIELISDHSGNLLICGLNVDSIENHSNGNVTIIGGDVGNIDDFSGNITLIGGTVTGSVTNTVGTITELP